MKKHTWTVIGHYDSTGETFAYAIRATSPHEAMRLSINGDYADAESPADVVVIGAIKGEHTGLIAPCEDSNKIAYGSDLIEED